MVIIFCIEKNLFQIYFCNQLDISSCSQSKELASQDVVRSIDVVRGNNREISVAFMPMGILLLFSLFLQRRFHKNDSGVKVNIHLFHLSFHSADIVSVYCASLQCPHSYQIHVSPITVFVTRKFDRKCYHG